MILPSLKKITAIFLVVFLYACQSRVFGATTIYSSKNQYGSIFIDENNNERCLFFGVHAKITQSCMLKDQPDRLIFDYTKMVLGALYINPSPKKILMIGLGGGSITKALSRVLPQAKIDIVELNPALPGVAKNYFMLEEKPNIKIYIEDGVEFIKKTPAGSYDLILLDAFGEDYIPLAFLTTEFVRQVKEALTKNGIIAVNTFVNNKHHQLENELYHEGFGAFFNLVSEGNRIILIKKDGLPSKELIEQNANKFAFSFILLGIDKNWLLEKFEKME